MVRSYKELNALEQQGLRKILMDDGWDFCRLSSQKEGDRQALTKKIGNKAISVEINHFHVDED